MVMTPRLSPTQRRVLGYAIAHGGLGPADKRFVAAMLETTPAVVTRQSRILVNRGLLCGTSVYRATDAGRAAFTAAARKGGHDG